MLNKEARGPEGVKRFHEAYNKEAFPDAYVTVEDQLPLP